MFNKSFMIVALATAMFLTGCGRSNQAANPVQNAPIPGVGLTPGGFTPGAPTGSNSPSPAAANKVTFTPVSFEELNAYVATRPLNNPSNIELTVALTVTGENRYAGTVSISYMDNGQFYNGVFRANSGLNQRCSNCRDNDKYEAEYNYWFNLNGKTNFSGFFQDGYGSIVLVIDNVVNQGDAQGSALVSGSVFYKNFADVYPQSTFRKCWFIYNGPFDCRESSVINKSAVEPTTNGYRKLGTFSGLSVSAAFR